MVKRSGGFKKIFLLLKKGKKKKKRLMRDKVRTKNVEMRVIK